MRAALSLGLAATLALSSSVAAARTSEPTITVMSAERALLHQPAIAVHFRYVYVFADEVLRYDTLMDSFTRMGVSVGHSKTSSAVFDGRRYVYVFGGREGAGASDKISRYDVMTNQVTLMGGRLPTVRGFTSAVWAERVAYVFGGGGNCDADGCHQVNEIVRYDPSSDSVSRMSAVLKPGPGGNDGTIDTSAIWTGRYVYIFGGCCPFTDTVLRYDPVLDSVATMRGALPTPRGNTSAVWDGTHAYVFGGVQAHGKDISKADYYADVVRYDPSTDAASVLPVTLPSPREGTSAAWAQPGRAYIFGGFRWTPTTPDDPIRQVLRFLPDGGAPPVIRGGS